MIPWLNSELLLVSLKALALSLILTPILRDIFRSYDVVDRPGYRRVHVYPIPRIGGIPIAVGYAVALYGVTELKDNLGFDIWKLIPGATVIFLTGLIDDFWNLRPVVKLGGQIIAALVVFASGLRIETLGAGEPLPLWLNLPLTVFWLLLTTNAFNLIDGLDGLCGGIGLLATLTMFGGALLSGNEPLAYATLPLACALAGFLFYNFNPATVFLGDSGALLIGFLLGCYGMIWTQKTSTLFSLLVPLMALSVPLLDVGVAVLRRSLSRQPIFKADRAHIHHRLLDRGLTPQNTVLVLWVFAALAAGMALLLTAPQVEPYRNLLLAILAVGILFGLRELRYKEFVDLGKMLFSADMRHTLEVKVELERWSHELSSKKTTEEWWKAVTVAGERFGWIRLYWVGPAGIQERVYGETAPDWTFLVPLGNQGSLQIDGRAEDGRFTISELAAVLAKSAATLPRTGKTSKVHST